MFTYGGLAYKTNTSQSTICYLPYRAVRPLEILLVEDDSSDAEFTRTALDTTNIAYHMERLTNGMDVIPHLIRRSLFTDNKPMPDLILLDLGLPCQDGFELLADFASLSPGLRSIPITILTGYEDFEYLKKSYDQLCISGYLTKPCSSDKLREVLIAATYR